MISEESHPQMQIALKELRELVSKLLGRSMSQSAIDAAGDMVRYHRARWRKMGVDFPVLTPMIVPRLGIINLVRADLDRGSIQTTVVNMLREHEALGITMEDVVAAVRGAFPDFRPDQDKMKFKKRVVN